MTLAIFGASMIFTQTMSHAESLTPILTYEMSHELLIGEDRQRIEVFADGRVEVHYPAFMKKAGDYTIELQPDELQSIVGALNRTEVRGFDAQAHADHRAAKAAHGLTRELRTDQSYSHFKIRRDGNGQAGTNHATTTQSIRWAHLQADARANPGDTALRLLALIESKLSEL